jgi:hypothetical protein
MEKKIDLKCLIHMLCAVAGCGGVICASEGEWLIRWFY